MTTTQQQQREALKALLDKKDILEAEICAIGEELETSGVGLKGNLVDKEGFPRADVDIYRITTLRSRSATLNYDLSQLMKRIEVDLMALHAAQQMPDPASSSQGDDARFRPSNLQPFAKIDAVNENAPAYKADIRVDDLILKFGPVTAEDIKIQGLKVLAAHVAEGKVVRVRIKRGEGVIKTVSVTPEYGEGYEGLLGLHFVPI